MDPTIVVAIIGIIGTISVAIINKYNSVKNNNKLLREKNKELNSELTIIKVLIDNDFVNEFESIASNIFNNTKVDRIMFFYAVNGKKPFNVVTAFMEKRRYYDVGTFKKYTKLPVDEEYKKMLRFIESEGFIYYNVKEMPDSLLKNIYNSPDENVKHSKISFINRRSLNDRDDVLLYVSCSTGVDIPFTEYEKTNLTINLNKIRNKINHLKIKQYDIHDSWTSQ